MTDSSFTDLRKHWNDSAEKERPKREAWAHPNMQQICHLTNEMRNEGWSEISYCPKDGSSFLAWNPLCSLPYICTYSGKWPDGKWWAHVDGDVWPDKPMMWKPIPSDKLMMDAGD